MPERRASQSYSLLWGGFGLSVLLSERWLHFPSAPASVQQSVQELSKRLSISPPPVYELTDPGVGASARGGSGCSSIVVTSGTQDLPTDQIEASLSHELVHIKNHDMLSRMALITAIGVVGAALALGFVAEWAMSVAIVLFLLVSWAQEFIADWQGGRACGDNLALSRVLSLSKDRYWLLGFALFVGLLVCLHYLGIVPFALALLLSYAAASWLPVHPPTFVRKWLLETLCESNGPHR